MKKQRNLKVTREAHPVKRNLKVTRKTAPSPQSSPSRGEDKGEGETRPSKAEVKAEVQQAARALLSSIAQYQGWINEATDRCNAHVQTIMKRYEPHIHKLQASLASDGKDLISLMKKNKNILFDKKDVVRFEVGSLIHNIADKVSIPKDAVEQCKAQKFLDAIKIVEHADRDVIEQWPDAKLLLIGASRKTKEEFGYDLKVTRAGGGKV